jgi:hypothetical protein
VESSKSPTEAEAEEVGGKDSGGSNEHEEVADRVDLGVNQIPMHEETLQGDGDGSLVKDGITQPKLCVS